MSKARTDNLIDPKRCFRCRKGGFTEKPASGDGRPEFTCEACGHTWTCGRDGGPWKGHARRVCSRSAA